MKNDFLWSSSWKLFEQWLIVVLSALIDSLEQDLSLLRSPFLFYVT
jgi:hypothetical protein